MTVTGPNSPITGATTGSPAWVNPDRLIASDNSRATNRNLPISSVTGTLTATGFGFAIPGTDNIDGILVEWEKSGDTSSIVDEAIRLVTGGVAVGDNKADTVTLWPNATGETYSSYGGATDKWGRTWTPAEVNSPSFGTSLVARNTNTGATRDAVVDHVRITVFHSSGTSVTVVEGAGSLTGTGTLTASGEVVVPPIEGAASLAGSSSLTANGTVIVSGSASLTGAGALEAQSLGINLGAASLEGSGILETTSEVIVLGSAALVGTGELNASAMGIQFGSATLTGTGHLSATPDGVTPVVTGSATLTGSSELGATADVLVIASAALVGSSDLAATATGVQLATATLAGSGSMTAQAEVLAIGAASLVGVSSLTADGRTIDPNAQATGALLRLGFQAGLRTGT